MPDTGLWFISASLKHDQLDLNPTSAPEKRDIQLPARVRHTAVSDTANAGCFRQPVAIGRPAADRSIGASKRK